MPKPTLLEMLSEMRNPDSNILESKSNFTFQETGKSIKIKNEKTGKTKVLKNSDLKDFQSQLNSFQTKMKGSSGTFDKFMVTYGYDELLESEDYKYNKPSKDNKENEMPKTSKKDAMKADKMPKNAKADDDMSDEEMEEATRYQRELAEKDNPFKKKDKDDSDDDDSDKSDDSDSDDDKPKDSDEKDDGKLTKDDDDDSDKSDDDDDEQMDEGLTLEDIIQEEVDAVNIDFSEILEAIGQEADTITEEEKVLFLKMGKLMEARIKSSIQTTGNRMVDIMEDCNEEFQEWLTAKMDKYTSKVISEWKAENHVSVQANAKATLNENVVTQILTVLEDNNINISESDISKVEAMEATLSERDTTISQISEEILDASKEIESLKKANIRKDFIIEDDDKRDIFDSLLEDVDYTNDADYTNRLTVLHDKYIVENKTVKSDEKDDADVVSLVEDIHMFEDIDIDVDGLIDETKTEVSHPSGRVSTLLESLKR